MTGKKQIEKAAKTLFYASLTGGKIDTKKVQTILNIVTKEKPLGLIHLLRAYKKHIAHTMSWEKVVIETPDASALPENYKAAIKRQTGATRITSKINADIVFGARVTHGDMIWDNTLEAKLNQLGGKG